MRVTTILKRKVFAGNKSKLARICEVTRQTVHNWINDDNLIPTKYESKVRQVLSQQSQNAGVRGR